MSSATRVASRTVSSWFTINEYVVRNQRLIRVWGVFYPLLAFLSGLAALVALAPGHDLVVGYRQPRRDPWLRRLNGWGWNVLIRVLFGAVVSLLLPRLGAGKSAALALVLGVVFLGAGGWLFAAKGLWIKVLYPTLTLAMCGMGAVSTVHARALSSCHQGVARDCSCGTYAAT